MRSYGVGYDTGIVLADRSTRAAFDEVVVRRELGIIRTDLHASAVRVYGNHRDRLTTCGRLALEADLDLWLAPFPVDVDAGDLPAYLATYAADAEALRSRRSDGDGPEVVLVLGCELSLSARGFVPGDTWDQRAAALTDPASFADPARFAELQRGLERWRQTQQAIAGAARAVFGGRITYAAGMWEEVDWSLFDVVSVDAYRDATNAATFADTVRGWHSHGKPVAVTEFGCATYRGAADRGGTGWAVVDRGVDPPRLDGDYLRDEQEQVRYLRELLPVLEAGASTRRSGSVSRASSSRTARRTRTAISTCRRTVSSRCSTRGTARGTRRRGGSRRRCSTPWPSSTAGARRAAPAPLRPGGRFHIASDVGTSISARGA